MADNDYFKLQVRLCQEHALQLTYRKDKDALKAQRKAKRKAADAMDLTEKHFDTGRSKSKLSTEKSLITEEKAESGHGGAMTSSVINCLM